MQKVHHIVRTEESDRHVRLFIPGDKEPDFNHLWQTFITDVAFSTYGDSKHQLPGLLQTFVLMMNSVTLADRGFSTLDIPIVTPAQGNILAALYYAVFHHARQRQKNRRTKIENNKTDLQKPELTEKEQAKRVKEIARDEEMQAREADKYSSNFQKFVIEAIKAQSLLWEESRKYETALQQSDLTPKERKALEKKKAKVTGKIVFSEPFVHQRMTLISEGITNPFEFIIRDRSDHPEVYRPLGEIPTYFTKTATDQISAVKGDIFAKCILEMYRLLDLTDYAPLPPPLLSLNPTVQGFRSSGDDSKGFCYSCGRTIETKESDWKMARFMFERPYQRRQSSANEGQPNVCNTCAVLSFASPIKVSDKSIILRLDEKVSFQDAAQRSREPEQKLKEYIRMLTSKEVHLSAGRYVVLTADKTNNGEVASQKLGKLQFALAKVASTFPLEVLSDFSFSLLIQSSQPISLKTRHLLFIKGLIDNYYQSIITSGKEVNQGLGEAIRYVQQDFPCLAEYALLKKTSSSNSYDMEEVRSLYWENVQKQTNHLTGDAMEKKRAKLYQDVAALTGLLFPFINRLDKTLQGKAKSNEEKSTGKKDPDREVSKLIEQVEDATSFCYYATLGIDKTVEAKLYKNRDNHFIYQQMSELLSTIEIQGRDGVDEKTKSDFIQLCADDISKAYTHFASQDYAEPRDWKELTYQLKLSLYTRFPRLVRK
ncbi:MAG: hypothetical protein AAFQ95_04595 [Cyanobacteria bacterium J06621_3]